MNDKTVKLIQKLSYAIETEMKLHGIQGCVVQTFEINDGAGVGFEYEVESIQISGYKHEFIWPDYVRCAVYFYDNGISNVNVVYNDFHTKSSEENLESHLKKTWDTVTTLVSGEI